MKQIHINCDLGEGGRFDARLMPLISACNIACGGHAGDPSTMQKTVKLAIANNVEIGAHPSYPDRENFGRISMKLSEEDLSNSILSQLQSLSKIVTSEIGKITHIKPHGALYNDAAKDEKIARIILNSILDFDEKLVLYVPRNSVISELGRGKIKMFFEAFADRNYTENYTLVSRQKSHALITEKEEVFKHLFSMFFEHKIFAENGVILESKADTFCLHSDTPNSVEILKFIQRKFADYNIEIK
jgi:5-oxoprolinase (ATP-hydrolysing) subunit A